MERNVNLAAHLPPFMAEYEQIKEALEAENPEFLLLWQACSRVLKNEFIATADEQGVSRFEKLLQLWPSSGDSLEVRRARVQARWLAELPYTWRALKAKLDTLAGEDYNLTWQDYEIALEVGAALLAEDKLLELRQMIEAYAPANMRVAVSAAEESGLPGWALLLCTGEEISDGTIAEVF